MGRVLGVLGCEKAYLELPQLAGKHVSARNVLPRILYQCQSPTLFHGVSQTALNATAIPFCIVVSALLLSFFATRCAVVL